MIEWLSENKEWIFSGIGVSAIIFCWSLFKYPFQKNKRYQANENGGNKIHISDQASIYGSVAGRDLNIYNSTPKIFEHNIPLERYRGNIQGNFIKLNQTIERAIEKLERQPKFPILYGAPPVGVQIAFLKTYQETVKDIEMKFFSALDSEDLVAAHEVLNKLREIAMGHSKSLIRHRKLYEASMTMDRAGGGFHGTYIGLEKIVLDSLDPFYE